MRRHDRVDLKTYKSKLDARLGYAILLTLVFVATILAVYGAIHQSVHSDLSSYVNRTHQIVNELERAIAENYGGLNETSTTETSKQWMTATELEEYAEDLRDTNSTVWHLFVANLVFALLLVPILVVYHCDVLEGSLVKLLFRVLLAVCLLFLVVQFFLLLYPLFFSTLGFPAMVDRLFVEAWPRDEYQRRYIEDSHACQFEVQQQLVYYDLQSPCIPKLKNSLFPAYAVFLLILLDLFPFAFAVFTYAWSACIKDEQHVKNVRTRVHINKRFRSDQLVV